jgi:hypothetical protein
MASPSRMVSARHLAVGKRLVGCLLGLRPGGDIVSTVGGLTR